MLIIALVHKLRQLKPIFTKLTGGQGNVRYTPLLAPQRDLPASNLSRINLGD